MHLNVVQKYLSTADTCNQGTGNQGTGMCIPYVQLSVELYKCNIAEEINQIKFK